MPRLRTILVLFVSILLSSAWSHTAFAQRTKINVGYSAISGDQLPAWVAKEAGIFEKNGLDVQLIFFTGGTTAVMALVSADTPMSQVAGAAVVNSALAGSDTCSSLVASHQLNYYLMAQPQIKRPSS
jgi:ABC-type nitrate/sulfonate/bicarbonate transport system substrate-binding protein